MKTASAKVYQSQVKVGQAIPDFSAPMTGNKTFQLSEMKGKKVVIYFYPKDATPGCTIEGKDFTCLHEEFKSAGVEVFGVSRDTISSHEKFKQNQGYTIDLISDENEKMCSIFGAIKLKNMYGKQVRGIDRSTFVVNENGELVREWREVKVPDHAKEVLDFVKNS
ncbi:MAG: peroxiredoxin [Bdellovibrionales bacterium]|nr:peroxiredoxin [Bdellovibrionales bacterium]